MKKRTIIFGILGLLALDSLVFGVNAYADCVYVPDKQIEVKIQRITSPVYDASGNELSGCILHANEKVLGYTQEEILCRSKLDSNIMVRLTYGCCDTGPDYGDVECIIRSKSFLGMGLAHGNGVMVHSIAPQ